MNCDELLDQLMEDTVVPTVGMTADTAGTVGTTADTAGTVGTTVGTTTDTVVGTSETATSQRR